MSENQEHGMQIHGTDVLINTAMSVPAQKRLLLTYFKGLYPCGVHEDVNDRGFIFYVDQKSMDDWNRDGRTEENADKMFYVICDEGCLTLVHENTGLDISEIRRNLRANACF
jgi:hypothetical protein